MSTCGDGNPGSGRPGTKYFDTGFDLREGESRTLFKAHITIPGGPMRRVLLLALCVSGALALTACPSKPKNGECKSSQDCADQAGYGKVCVDGQCQECGQDSDCQ